MPIAGNDTAGHVVRAILRPGRDVCQPPAWTGSDSDWMWCIKPGAGGTGGRCHTPSGQEPV